MAVRRRAAVLFVILFVLASLGAARAQFGNPLKKTGPKPATAPPSGKKLYCEDITPEKVEQLLKGLKAERAAHENALAMDRAAEASQAASDQAAAQRMMAAMEKQAACEQTAQEKDPRYKQAERLSELRNKAQDRGDEAAADKYGEQFAALTDELEQMARKACANNDCIAKAKAESPMHKMVADLKAAAAKEKDPDRKAMLETQITGYFGMIDSEAEIKCSAMSAGVASGTEQAASQAAADAARKAKAGAAAEGAKAAGVTEEEYARLVECAIGALNNPSATPLTSDSQKSLDQRSPDLQPALKAAGR
jgi:hypothetical protein